MWAIDGVDQQGKNRRAYRCFLIRCWLTDSTEPGEEPMWRFAVQQAGKNDLRRCFSRLDDVEAYLGSELALCAELAGREAE